MRWRRAVILSLPAIAITALLFRFFFPPLPVVGPQPISQVKPGSSFESLKPAVEDWVATPSPHGKSEPADTRWHPIIQLVQDASTAFEQTKASQSRTLADAVNDYKRRYKVHPPPHFDKWYEFAAKNGVKMIDEYDTIYDTLLPFWGLHPRTIRKRVKEAIGYEDNALIAVIIRSGKIERIEGGSPAYQWQKDVTHGMIEKFAKFLPDMDLAFNIHDEPRVVVPHDELELMLRKAQGQALPAVLANNNLRNSFSPRPADVNDGKRIDESKRTRFNEYAHQATWVPSRMSCPLDSPARSLGEDDASDIMTDYAFGQLGFIRNQTAYSDICVTPSLRNSHGFFDRPNAFKLTHELIPIFSQSKVSSYQDLLYPSPWYWYGKRVTDEPADTHKLQYDETQDKEWADKNNTIWWRGSTTGGYSSAGGWRRQHRQRFVRKVNALDQARILVDHVTAEGQHEWQAESVPRADYEELIDIKFSHVGQCEAGDCDAQKEYFELVDQVDAQEAWGYKYLLDIDGNAFSGRFYGFLKSKSLPFKAAIFREWHQEWLMPWVHYVPLSLRGEEVLEAVRFFAFDEADGVKMAPHLANQGRDWANQVLRRVDMEAWFFRLLLEYGRVIDDNRHSIGFTPH